MELDGFPGLVEEFGEGEAFLGVERAVVGVAEDEAVMGVEAVD